MAILDKIPDSTWFFCFPMSLAVWCIVILGIIHPLFWLRVWRVYRSELFIFMYVLVGFWAVLSCALIYGILAESSCIYVFWIWYTMVFGATMAVLMFLLFCGFCVLGMKRKSVGAMLALLYYIITLYFVVVVNKQRKEIFGLNAYCGSCAHRHGPPDAPGFVDSSLRSEINTTTDTTTTTTTTTPTTTTTITMPTTTTAITMLTTETTTTTEAKTTALTTTSPPLPSKIDGSVANALKSLASYFTRTDTTHIPFTLPRTRSWAGSLYRRDAPGGPPNSSSLLPHHDLDRGLSVISRLSSLLVNSEECLTPRQPAHGRFEVAGDRAALHLTLHCDQGYMENSKSTVCKRNWWDRPIPHCRKRHVPPPAAGCTLPRYPEHGNYTVVEHAHARPGQVVAAEVVVLAVACAPPRRAVDAHVMCVRGRWRHAPPDCQKHCKLHPHPSVDYKCLNAFKNTIVACASLVEGGGLVVPSCRPAHAHRGPYLYMRCRAGSWDHVITCTHNSNFTN